VLSVRRLVLVRHGESVWNVERRVQGHECRGLTDHGRVQAEHTARSIAERWPEARVLSSDLGRCVTTATPIAAALGTDLEVDAALRERYFGRWEGLDRPGIEQDDPGRFLRWRAGEDVIAEVGGESDADLRRRAAATFAQLLADVVPEDGTVVAVSHGGTIWYGVHELLRLGGARLGAVDNASVTELVIGGWAPAGVDLEAPRLQRFNETSHLAGARSA